MTLTRPRARPTGGRAVWPLLVATGVSVAGDGALIAAAPLLASSITSDPLAVSSITAAAYLPWLLFGLPAGALADRSERRKIMIAADLARAALLAALVGLILADSISILTLVSVILAMGFAQCLFDSSSQAVIAAIVGRDKETLTKVNGQFWAVDIVGRSLAGPPIGSALFTVGRALPFVADALSFLLSAVFVSRLPAIEPPPSDRRSLLASAKDGLRFLFRTRELLVLALSTGAYNFGYNLAIATFVLYARQRLGVTELVYGLLLSTTAIGGVVAGWLAPRLAGRRSYRAVQAAALLVQAGAWFGVSLTTSPWIVAPLFASLGAASTLSTVAIASARQMLTPDEMLGRVVSSFRLLGVGAAALGALLGGVAAEVGTLRTPQLVAAVLLATSALLIAPRSRWFQGGAANPGSSGGAQGSSGK